jgi:DnaD/phage-associated family protein
MTPTSEFKGFPDGKVRLVPVPEPFFTQLLPGLGDPDQLRLLLHIFWRLDRMEGTIRYLLHGDFSQDAIVAGIFAGQDPIQPRLEAALEGLVRCGALLKGTAGRTEVVYLLNTPRGRAALHSLQHGEWQPGERLEMPPSPAESSGIFRLYEQNIGPLTPLIADQLTEAEREYSAEWIHEAFKIAVERNKRNWRYIAAILNRWQTEGRDDRKNRSDAQKDGRKYIEGEFSDFIEH